VTSRSFGSEVREAVSPRAIALVLGVLALQLGFILSYIGAFHSPTPHRVKVAVVAPASVRPAVIEQLNALPGEPAHAVAGTDKATAASAILRRDVDVALVVNPAGDTDTLLIASAAGPALSQVATEVGQRIEASRQRQLTVQDLRPPAPGDGRGLSSFYVVIGWMVGGYLAAAILGVTAGSRPANRDRAVIRLGALAVYSVVSGLGGALIAGPILDALPGPFLALAGIGALVVFAAAAATMALQVLFGVVGIGVAILFFVVLGNPSAGGPYPSTLLPGFWRGIGPWLPPGAGTTAVRNTAYFDGHAILAAMLLLAGYALIGGVVALVGATLLSRRGPRSPGAAAAPLAAS